METEKETVADVAVNLRRVLDRIAAAARRTGREPSEVQLVAVTKGQPPEVVRAGYAAGLRDFGENRVEEALPKIPTLAELAEARWHMIGHIQSRKARVVPRLFTMVHSVDRERIARLLDRYAGEVGFRLPVLLECNVSGEVSKEGWRLHDPEAWRPALEAFRQVVSMPHLEVRGLMTMAPLTEDVEQVRRAFRRLRQLRDFLAARLPGEWGVLSMGMTDDFEVAIEEGATCVRIGRAIFGPRPADGPLSGL